MAGPAPFPDQGDYDGNVPIDSLERHRWLYESDYYQSLLDKANLTNPTPLTSSGEKIEIMHACVHRDLGPCKLLETFFIPNLTERTQGQIEFEVSSFAELGVAGQDAPILVADGSLDSATLFGLYMDEVMPAVGIQYLWGISSSREQVFEATEAIIGDIEDLTLAETGGVILNHNWYPLLYDWYFFCTERVESPADFDRKKTRSNSRVLSHWIEGMGAASQFIAYVEVYLALERDILECAASNAHWAHLHSWYEVTDYIIGPLFHFPSHNNVINAEKWASIPEDLQRIIIEEAAKSELEALRLAAIQNEMGLTRNVDAGMEFIPFSDDVKFLSRQVALSHVIPGWIEHVGNPEDPIFALFNEKISPIVGIRIEEDGTVDSPAESCDQHLYGDGVFSDQWVKGCRSVNRSGSYARYYTFNLSAESEVTISLNSNANTFLYLLQGSGITGAVLRENDNMEVVTNLNSRIQETLQPRTYTIEATTYDPAITGSFTLGISGLATTGPTTTPSGEFLALSSGANHVCALLGDGSALCWGDNSRGQATPPQEVRLKSISSGDTPPAACGLTARPASAGAASPEPSRHRSKYAA